MSKYQKLWEFLKKSGKKELKLTYEEIRSIVGFDLDHSFLTYKKEAGQYGYQVGKISMKEKTVLFYKIDDE